MTAQKKAKSHKKVLLKEVEPEALKLLGEETRRKIMDLVRDRELNVCAISEELGITPQTIYHHVKKLEKAGLIHVTREERCGHWIESYYQATAENFCSCSGGKLEGELSKEDPIEVLNGLNEIGFEMDVDEDKALRLRELQKRRTKFTKLRSPVDEMCSKCGSTGFFLKSGLIDSLKLDKIYHYANLMMLTDEEFEESVRLDRELRKFLHSISKEKPKT